MAGRREKVRCVGIVPEYVGFAPEGLPSGADVTLSLDELEAIRLLDLCGLSQADAAESMGVARTTVTSIYDRARRKVADALVNGRRLVIEGGNVAYRPPCPRQPAWPAKMREGLMRIAVTYDNGMVFQHFGRTAQFKLYDVEGDAVVSSRVVDTNGEGHGALAGLLSSGGVNVLVCGGIGGGAQAALARAGIFVYAGNSGSADAAVAAYLRGELSQTTAATCHDHDHGEGHDCAHHACGSHTEDGCCH